MALTVHLKQPHEHTAEQAPAPLSLWEQEPVVLLGESRDAQGFPLPVTPSARTLFGPRGCCLVSSNGPLWVADTGHHRLLGWRNCPSANGAAAEWVIGQPDFASEGRNARTKPGRLTLNVPTGMTLYGKGLAVADAWNHRVLLWREVPSASHCPPDLVLGQEEFREVDINRGRAVPGPDTLYWPYGVASWGDRLLVADTGNRRLLIWLTPPSRHGQPADLVLGQTSFARRDENAGGTPSAMSMRWPHATARWENRLCVADAGNNRIMVWNEFPTACGSACDRILGQVDAEHVDHNGGHYWPHAGSLNMPYGVASAGAWLVATDTANSRLVGWHALDAGTGAEARALAGQPTFGLKGDNQWLFPTRETLCWPYGLSVCGNRLAVADSGNNRVMIRSLGREVAE